MQTVPHSATQQHRNSSYKLSDAKDLGKIQMALPLMGPPNAGGVGYKMATSVMDSEKCSEWAFKLACRISI